MDTTLQRVIEEAASRRSASSTSPETQRREWFHEANRSWAAAGWPIRCRKALRDYSPEATAESHRGMFSRVPPRQLDAAIAAVQAEGGSVVLCGPRGRGKTLLACWLGLLAALAEPGTQRYAVWRRALSQEKRSFAGTDKAILPELERARFLVLDEVQEDLDRDFGRAALTDLIDHRYGDMTRTVVVANCTPDQLQALLGTSALSRLNETGPVLHCEWEAYR